MMRRVASRARSSKWWQGRARAAFTDRLALKVTALALAIVLWFSVTVREPAEQSVPVRFMPSLEPGLTLGEQPATIRAVVRGSGREILKLYTTPPAIRISIGGEVGDSMPVTLRPADVDLPPGVNVVVRDVQPRRITLVFRRRRGQAPQRAGAGWARPTAPNTPAPATPVLPGPPFPVPADTPGADAGNAGNAGNARNAPPISSGDTMGPRLP